ncbi:hypothetical protein TNCT_714811 [Trichonephila clavata]|uniref:Uncharacterized protein n=1 Tax=Trichonephila clavata TaxID=2740835 RepID=A0A8X6HGS4_TRICU|nr:hypothetical protein TNCT_714811 [Trichonephila clavata]
MSEPAKMKLSEFEKTPTTKANTNFGLMSAMTEFRKFFHELPGLLEAGKTLRNAASLEEKADIYFGNSLGICLTVELWLVVFSGSE